MSYSRKDEDAMRSIAKFLRAEGIKVWVDNEKLIPGTPIWEDEVEKAITSATAIVVILSPESKNSEWVKREISLADQHHKRIFPVLVRGDENTSISLRLINRQYVDLRGAKEKSLKSLSDALSFYMSELSQQEQKAVSDQAQRPLPAPATNVQNPIQRVPVEKVSRPSPGKEGTRKTDPKQPEASGKTGVFGWFARGDPKRLISQ